MQYFMLLLAFSGIFYVVSGGAGLWIIGLLIAIPAMLFMALLLVNGLGYKMRKDHCQS